MTPAMSDVANNNHGGGGGGDRQGGEDAAAQQRTAPDGASPKVVAPLKMPPQQQQGGLPTAPGTPGTPGATPGPAPVPQTPTGAAPQHQQAAASPSANAFEIDLPQELLHQGEREANTLRQLIRKPFLSFFAQRAVTLWAILWPSPCQSCRCHGHRSSG